MPDKKTRGISNLPVAIPDVPDAPTVSANNVGTSRAYNNGSATVTITPTTGGLPSSYSIATTPITTTTTATGSTAITGLSSATSYTATVTPSNVSATGASTTTTSFTATTIPQAPTIGTFTNGGTGTTGTLSFTAGATGGSSITGYTYSTDGTNYSAASGTTSPFSLTGLTEGTYTFYLKATNANGTSLASTGVSGTVFNPFSYESIYTVTVPNGGQSTVSFTSIPTTFKHLQIRGLVRDGAATTYSFYRIRFNSDTGSNYRDHLIFGNGSIKGGDTYSLTYHNLDGIAGGAATAGIFGSTIVDILDYTSTTKNKTLRALVGTDRNGAGEIYFNSGLYYATPSAISTITLTPGTGNFAEYSSFALYGIRG